MRKTIALWLRAVLLLTLLVAGCREGAPPYAVESPFVSDSTGQLTFNPGWDHTPAWNQNGDSVYYAAESYPGFPDTRGIVLAVPRTSGRASVILPTLQLGVSSQPWLAAPTIAADGRSIAFFELTDIRDHRDLGTIRCAGPEVVILDSAGTAAPLAGVRLRVRSVNSTSPADDATLPITFAGRTSAANDPAVVSVAYPFQRMFEREGVPIFRASWSPDGGRLVFSDGSLLHVWSVGAPSATPLVGTDGAIMPAWSPDGNWIAFSKPFVGQARRILCEGWFSPNPGSMERANVIFDRTFYTPFTREDASLMLVRPDGTGLRALGEGDGPAWSPDNRTIVAHRDGSLYRISVETGAATLIPNTLHGYEPAISRDGRFMAFAKRTEIGRPGIVFGVNSAGNYDIWVAPF